MINKQPDGSAEVDDLEWQIAVILRWFTEFSFEMTANYVEVVEDRPVPPTTET